MNALIELKEGLLIAWEAIRANKLRSWLTTLRRIIIGIVSVTLMGAAIDGLNRSFREGMSSMGSDVLFADRMNWFINSEDEWLKEYKRRTVTMDQVRAVERQNGVRGGRGRRRCMSVTSVRYQDHSTGRVQVIGTNGPVSIDFGSRRFCGTISDGGDTDGGRPVCVIGK